MKALKILSTLLALMAVMGCSKDSIEVLDESNTQRAKINNKTGEIPSNEFIVKYIPDLTEDQKEVLRNKYEVVDIKQCPCADPTLELWIFDPELNPLIIEERKSSATEEPEVEGTEYNNSSQITSDLAFGQTQEDINLGINLQTAINEGVTVAVIDTGITYSEFNGAFLYNNASNPVCVEATQTDYFGWDFVNEDNNPYDDSVMKHGTTVTKVITNYLGVNRIKYNLLPIKAFNDEGQGKDFDILCAFKYAVSKPEVKIINLSFGNYASNSFFNDFINEVMEKVLIVTSAGNDQNDNDIIQHFPSSFLAPSIITVAGLKDYSLVNPPSNVYAYSLDEEYSNYGMKSVDIAAPGRIPITAFDQSILTKGTSFSSAYVTARAIALYTNGQTPVILKSTIITNSMVLPSLQNKVSYGRGLVQ